MSEVKREALSSTLRELSLKVEKAAYDMSDQVSANFTSELMEMSARLCNAADAVEHPEMLGTNTDFDDQVTRPQMMNRSRRRH